MTRRRITLSDLPLFAEDNELAEAIVGQNAEKKARFRASLPRLEACGFPKHTLGYGRYVPEVKRFYDRAHGPHADTAIPPIQGHHEEEGTWNPRRKVRHRAPA